MQNLLKRSPPAKLNKDSLPRGTVFIHTVQGLSTPMMRIKKGWDEKEFKDDITPPTANIFWAVCLTGPHAGITFKFYENETHPDGIVENAGLTGEVKSC